jgi:EAL domain-containing protein (putative c-di-GMP-specific phosphodiesterase class I)
MDSAAAPSAGRDLAAILSGLEIVVQPIVSVATGDVLAVEALARFTLPGVTSSQEVIAEAHAAGYGFEVEAACITAALGKRADLPDDVLLTINVSPDGLHHPIIVSSWPDDLAGVIVEVTEQISNSPDAFARQIATLRRRGAAIAIDDVSTGYAGLLRLAMLRPDFVKIDRRVVSGVSSSIAQMAVLEALVNFSHRLGSPVIGEGIEDLDELRVLAEFDVDYAQGWAVAHPTPTLEPIDPAVIRAAQDSRRSMLGQPATVGGLAAHTRDMHGVTAALARARELADLHAAVGRAAKELDVDAIAVSVLRSDATVSEIANSGEVIDTRNYALADFPATREALETGASIEVHIDDGASDAAEQDLLRRMNWSSLLLVPVLLTGRPIGVLEFLHRSPRRWSTHDIAHARGLAEHLAQVLVRLGH